MGLVGKERIRRAVQDKYRQAAQGRGSGAACCGDSCCSGVAVGYSPQELASVPPGADLGLGCGNPQAIAGLQPSEVVLDLGCGPGLDCLLASSQVGPSGRVIGVDMTPEMLERARDNAAQGDFSNVEFRLGQIEHLPAADASVEVIISNCVINLAADKAAVYQEAFRVLAPGGRLAISDVVALKPLPAEIKNDLALWSGCVAGAMTIDELISILDQAGFVQVSITPRPASGGLMESWAPGKGLAEYVAPARIQARKPGA